MSNYGKTFSSKVQKTLKSNIFPTLYLVSESSIRAAETETSNIKRTKRVSSRNTKKLSMNFSLLPNKEV
uniref:THAP domaincontaining protein 4like [Acyrthosiphon pisum] n=1 Tax=Lepeophtheirus salmonis TaxID=72036 RepID=A0A0K2USJ9_LEPSM